MNEFTAKKLGEVLAFATVGLETFEIGQEALASVLGESDLSRFTADFDRHREILEQIAEKEEVSEIVQKKQEATETKLKAMRDLYIGEQWDNPTEILEWSGFFEGAAIVHWCLVDGAGQGTENVELMDLAEDATIVHKDLLEAIEELLRETGNRKGIE